MNEMGRFVVRVLPSETNETVEERIEARKTAADGLSSGIDWLWSTLSSPRMLQVLGVLLGLWCIGILVLPGSRPG
ncbi:MAG: hypothetical protein ACYCYF_11655, partial [Anaerolineae bacterium]